MHFNAQWRNTKYLRGELSGSEYIKTFKSPGCVPLTEAIIQRADLVVTLGPSSPDLCFDLSPPAQT